MRTIFCVIICFLAMSVTATAQGHFISSSAGRSTTTFDSIAIRSGIHNIVVRNDTTAGTDTLWIAFHDDTTRSQMIPVKANETWTLYGASPRYIRTKSSANTIPRRIWGF
jgi:hypothetical protein